MASHSTTSGGGPDIAETAGRIGLLSALLRWRRLFVVVVGAVMAVTIAALIVLPVSYLASGSVIIAEQEPGLDNTSAAWAQKIGDPADLESQLLVVRSARVMRLAMATPGIVEEVRRECRYAGERGGMGLLPAAGEASCDRLKPDSNELIDYVQQRYLVGSVGRSRVMNIAYKSMLPDVAQKMANALIEAFLEDQRANLSSGREVAASWLWQELRQLDSDLHDEDAKIQNYRRAKGLMRGANAPITSERLTSTSQQLSAAETALAEAAARLQEIKADQEHGTSDASAILASRNVADLKQRLTTAVGQLANASATLGPRHPARQAMQDEVDSLKSRLAKEVASVAANAEKNYTATKDLVASLKQQLDSVKADVAAAASDEAAIESMVRSAEIKRNQYANLYKRASELETERRVLLGSTRLVSLAEFPNKPFFPKRLPFLAAGLTIALMLAFAVVLLRDRSDRSVRDTSRLAVATGAPIFAQIPQVRASGRSGLRGLMSLGGADLPLKQALALGLHDEILQNACRKMSGLLGSGLGPLKYRTLLMTSPGTQEGKTFATMALAQFMALQGRRVLVIECDLRKPALAAALNLTSGVGLADILLGGMAPRDAVVTTETQNLDVIVAGTVPAAFTGPPIGRRMLELLQWAHRYDLVLFDSPASDELLDASKLAVYVDGVLCCARWDQSSLAKATALAGRIRAAGGKVAGVIVNGVSRDEYVVHEPTPMAAQTLLKAS